MSVSLISVVLVAVGWPFTAVRLCVLAYAEADDGLGRHLYGNLSVLGLEVIECRRLYVFRIVESVIVADIPGCEDLCGDFRFSVSRDGDCYLSSVLKICVGESHIYDTLRIPGSSRVNYRTFTSV